MIERVVGASPYNVRKAKSSIDPNAERLSERLFFPYDDSQLKEIEREGIYNCDKWISAAGIVTGNKYAVPAIAVLQNWIAISGADVRFPEADATGFAAGVRRSGESLRVLRHGLFESLERHSIMMSWRVPGWPCARLGHGLVDSRIMDLL